jgi:hypothetical protein
MEPGIPVLYFENELYPISGYCITQEYENKTDFENISIWNSGRGAFWGIVSRDEQVLKIKLIASVSTLKF